MNLYLLSQTVNNDWDTYDSAIVAAESEEQARRIHPNPQFREFGDDGAIYFKFNDGTRRKEDGSHDWAELEYVKAKLIGQAIAGTEAGLILASYNAG